MSNNSIWLIDGTLTGATTPGQSGPASNDNEGVLHILQSSRTGAPSEFSIMSRTLNPLQRCSQCIQQPQQTGQGDRRKE